jgi:4'-phosphopantetheinyl transferase
MAEFVISPDTVHLWWARVSEAEPHLDRLRHTLSFNELERAARFRVEGAARRFVVARAVLRSVLGRATGVDPADVVFAYGEHGKPHLAATDLSFNASDTGDFVVVALASAELGVDIEVLRPLARQERLARRICTERELEAFMAIPEAQRDAALLRLWTCKEAALKALGTGLSGGVKNVEAKISGNRPPRLTRLPGGNDGWTLLFPNLLEDLVCSVVVRGPDWRVVSQPFLLHAT